MKIFIDDSGGFGWIAHGVSLFCGATISDKNFNAVMSNFHAWRPENPIILVYNQDDCRRPYLIPSKVNRAMQEL
jgi:hypothetical protein